MPALDVSVVVPLLDEATTVRELVARITRTLEDRGVTFEILLVDDGSTDGTVAILRALTAEHPAVRVFEFTRNFGQAAAISCGVFEARGDVVVTMDGDLQNPPEEIPKLLDALTADVGVVTARRARRHEQPLRRLGSRAIHRLARHLVPADIDDYGGQFKAYRRDAVEATRQVWAAGKPVFPLAIWLGFPVREISVRHDPRSVGSSRYDLPSLIRVNLDLVTSFTTLPLAGLAVGAVVAGGAGAAGIVGCLATGRTAGFGAALSLTLLGIGGVFAAAAALGLYLSRLYRTVTGGVGYVVRARHGGPRDGAADT